MQHDPVWTNKVTQKNQVTRGYQDWCHPRGGHKGVEGPLPLCQGQWGRAGHWRRTAHCRIMGHCWRLRLMVASGFCEGWPLVMMRRRRMLKKGTKMRLRVSEKRKNMMKMMMMNKIKWGNSGCCSFFVMKWSLKRCLSSRSFGPNNKQCPWWCVTSLLPHSTHTDHGPVLPPSPPFCIGGGGGRRGSEGMAQEHHGSQGNL